MQFITVAITAAVAGIAAAQSSCQAENIVQACTAQYQPQLQACFSQDYACLCTQSTNLLTCYNNCPNDPTRSSVQSENTQYCNAAKVYGSSTSSSSAGTTPTGSSGSSASATGPTSSSASPTLPAGVTASSSSSGSSASSTAKPVNGSGASEGNTVRASVAGLVMVVAGAVALL